MVMVGKIVSVCVFSVATVTCDHILNDKLLVNYISKKTLDE